MFKAWLMSSKVEFFTCRSRLGVSSLKVKVRGSDIKRKNKNYRNDHRIVIEDLGVNTPSFSFLKTSGDGRLLEASAADE